MRSLASWPIRGILALLAAAALSFFSAYMSVVGMYALFPAAGWVIIGSMIAIEIAKFISAESAYDDWKVRGHRFRKTYKTAAVITLMAITAMGVYGFLAKGHLEQAAPLAPVQLQIAQKEARQAQLSDELGRLTVQQNQINSSVDALIQNSQSARDARAGLRARTSAQGERQAVQSRIDAINAETNQINQDLVPLKMQVSEVATKLGPLQYVADLFGWDDPEAAVRLIILMLMFAFDPLAIVLLIDGTERMSTWAKRPDEPTMEEPQEPEGGPQPLTAPEVMTPAVVVAEPEVEPEPELTTPDVPAPYAVVDEPIPVEPTPSEPAPAATVLPMDDELPPFIPVPVPQTWAFEADKSLFRRPLETWEPRQDGNLLLELQQIIETRDIEESDKEKLIRILSDNPDLLDQVVSAVEESRTSDQTWLNIEKPNE